MPWTQPDFGKLTQQAFQAAKLGTVDLFRAPVGTVYDAANAWTYLGRLLPGSYKNDFSRQFFDVKTGIPETMKESFVIGVEGKIDFTLIEPTIDAYLLASGNAGKVPLFGAVPLATAAAAGTLSTTQMSVSDASGFEPGDMVEIERGTTKMYAYIIAINASVFDLYPRLPQAPVATDVVQKVRGWELGMGGSKVDRMAIRAVFHATDNTQIVTWAKDCRSMGMKDDFGDKKIVEVPVNLECFGFSDPLHEGPIVAKKLLLTSDLILNYD